MGNESYKRKGYEKIILQVVEWNQNAMMMYLKNGFSIKKREKVR